MADIQLTAAQQAAVEDRDGALLVSAAAGSGKTRVLVERLMARVCDPVHPRDIHAFLIITYTKAAAAELRAKISAELGRRLAQQPENRHLQRQLSLVYLTEISTVHAFCASLLRSYAHLRGIPSDFRVGEEAECGQLRQRALETLLEESYAAPDAQLLAAAELLGAGRDDRGLRDAVEALYRASQCHPYPDQWLDECRASLELPEGCSCADTLWGRALLERFGAFLDGQIAALRQALDDMAGVEALEKTYYPCFLESLERVEALRPLRSWDALAEAVPTSFGRLTAARGFEDKALLERLKAVRSDCLEGLRSWSSVFRGGEAAALADLRAAAPALRGALALTAQLTKRFTAEKRRRRILDFGDLEHETIALLLDRATGRPTAAAREIAERFEEVLVDEYQDSNEIQECIFAAVSRENANRFLVGDVKQSIYRFRLADPTIFLEKYRAFAPAAAAKPGEPRKRLLSENFRSRPEILSAVNDVFRAVMSEEVGDLTYGEDEALRPGRPFPPAADVPVELHCIDLGDGGAGEKDEVEAAFVAERVASLLREGRLETEEGSRPVRPGDVVILLRSVSSAAPAYLAALQRLGIPCASDRGESLLDTREVETLVAILRTVDNPRQDVPLVAALTSPAFGFDADDLAAVRSADRGSSFYDALEAAAAGGHEKAAGFLRTLRTLREQARWMPLHSLLRRICQETRLEAVFGAMADGRRRRANLEAFLAFADGRGPVTLMDFLDDLDGRIRQGQTIPVTGQAGGDAVQLMSIHKSKGLEFPVVILSDLSRRFNAEDLRRNVLTHPQLLAGCSVVDRETGVRYPTMARQAISLRLRQESLSEELRVLYVAMTRAQSRLIMTYCSRYLRSELEAAAAAAARPVAPAYCASVKNPGMWILAAAMTRTEAGELFAVGGRPRMAVVSETPWRIRLHEALRAETAELPPDAAPADAPPAETVEEARIVQHLAFRYPHAAATRVPSKVTATQLKGRRMDQEALAEAAELLPGRHPRRRRPQFIAETRGLTAAEKGTANHLFLQFADYAACRTAEGTAAETERLLRDAFLTAEQAAAVEQAQMVRLFTSPLGEEIFTAPKVHREMKFSVLADAALYDARAAGERLLLQGVVDCLLEAEEGLTVIDFKTDSVRPGREGARAAYYAGQLRAYALALERIFRKPVHRRLVYFLTTGCTVEIPET